MPPNNNESGEKLFQPVRLGSLELDHRVVLAPLTRMRSAQPGNVPTELMAEMYAQRAASAAGAGLLISEASQVSQQGQGYPGTPGIHSDEQVAGWRTVTDAVHRKGGQILLQLWHTGRASNHTHQADGAPPVAPSAIAIKDGKTLTASFEQIDAEVPRALETDEIAGVVEQFRSGALRAQRAGFDGVEVHGANGYLIEQFLDRHANTRDDRYGGSVENRARFLFEVLDAVLTVWPAGRVGLRLSPWGTFLGTTGTAEEREEQWGYVLRELQSRYPGLSYVHLIEARAVGSDAVPSDELEPQIPNLLQATGYKGNVIVAGGYTRKSGVDAVNAYATAVAYGRLFIANPDLPLRLKLDADLNKYDRATFYGGDAKGYTDYPRLEEEKAQGGAEAEAKL